MQILKPPTGLTIFHRGPSVEQGPLPTVFYFALSGSDSLQLDPYNQPINGLDLRRFRAISFNLPAHEEGDNPHEAIEQWAEQLKANPKYLENYLALCLENIDYLIEKKICDPKRLATAGLSRGGFIATHLAARHTHIHYVLGFAPMTAMRLLQEFQDFHYTSLNLSSITSKLIHKRIRYYIGNRDTRVDTATCFQFIQKVTEEAYQHRVRSPQTELIIFPSVGHKGHGTPPHIFEDGANWINKVLGE